MAQVLQLKTIAGSRGSLTVIEKEIPFPIKRIFYIYNVDNSVRGKHRHHKTIQAAICIKGACKIFIDDNEKEEVVLLDNPEKCLLLEPKDWHKMYDFTPDAVLLILASEYFDPADYIYEPYQ
jgi:dTDP-4-dehydrorhamnose 3,5-epimerase-like enzyme